MGLEGVWRRLPQISARQVIFIGRPRHRKVSWLSSDNVAWYAASACGGGSCPTAPPVVVPGPNRPPVISSVTVSPSFGVGDLEVFTYEVRATDSDGDALTYGVIER